MIRRNSVTIGEALDDMVREFRLKPKLNESRLKDNWRRIVGNTIANHTSNVSLKSGKLYLTVDAPSLKQELTYSKEKIRDLFNKEFGETVITDVIIF